MSNDPYAKVPLTGGGQKLVERVVEGPVSAPKRPPRAAPAPRVMSREVREGLDALETALQEQVAEQEEILEEPVKVDLGETAPEVAEKFHSVFYRNTPIDNPTTRAAIEERCSELDFADMLVSGRVSQLVPIIPGKLEVEFRSLRTSDNMWIEAKAFQIADEYKARVWAGYARLTATIASLNGTPLVEHLDKDGVVNEDAFDKKYAQVTALNEKLVESLFANMSWFEDRMAQLFSNDFEQIKNG